ncbi:zinc ribbon domain-containing protein [Sorangium sp. So ce327]|uniref:hypothetical protein n=1 Tax=Sorangium sp. So ce327 TaxID=3133301 RepID=UPI003F6015EE
MSAEQPAKSATSATADETVTRGTDSPLERQIVHYARFGAPLAALVGAGVAGLVAGPPAAILVLAGGALVAVIAIFWASLRVLIGETPLSGADAYAIGAPRAEEEQKQAVLRALKDLEFERSVGKISDEDYAELVAKYRAEAKRLLRLLDADAQPRREQVAALVERHLRRAGLQDDGAPREPDEAAATAEPAATQGVACGECGTLNDEDAVFCKKCGTKRALGAPQDDPAATDDAAATVDEDENDRRRAS